MTPRGLPAQLYPRAKTSHPLSDPPIMPVLVVVVCPDFVVANCVARVILRTPTRLNTSSLSKRAVEARLDDSNSDSSVGVDSSRAGLSNSTLNTGEGGGKRKRRGKGKTQTRQ